MKTKYITCISYHGTGSGAVDDFFREFDNIAFAPSEVECRYLQDPDGISDLEYNLIDNPHRLNSGFALKRYMIFAKSMAYTYGKIFGKNWLKYSREYIESLAKFSYKGYWHGDLRIISKYKLFIYYCRRAFSKIMPKKIRKETFYNYFPNIDSYHSYISREKFINNTHLYFSKLAKLLNRDNKEYLLFDQLVPPENISRYLKYMDNLKVIIVDRDPRDTYLNSILHKDHVLPKEVDKFCEVYKDIRKTRNEELKNKEVLLIRFEDMIFNYENTTKKIMGFLGLKDDNHINKKCVFKPEISKMNTQQWLKHTDYQKEINYIEKELTEYIYNFEEGN